MQKKYLYEYAVIRVVPRVEREEFINVGIILFSKEAKYLRSLYKLNANRYHCFTTELTVEEVEENLHAFDKICTGSYEGGEIAKLDVAERFRWLTAIRSTSIQTSRPHSGFSSNLDETIQHLFDELVL